MRSAARYRGHQDLIISLRLRDGAEAEVCPWCERIMVTGPAARHQRQPLACTVDHIVPKIEGGTDNLNNLVLVCYGCNTRRGKMPQ
ncbi:MAG: HNH endonuclease [Patescibacteria group bacterium]|nr:HNH endonuclease [Patescibacteria group bacterium]